jgi:hypothetical protein
MIKKIFSLMLLTAFIAADSPLLFCKHGGHVGEQKMLNVSIDFNNPSGKTITNSEGVFYHYYGIVVKENKVYPPKYWGEFPLYFVGNPANIKVAVTNNGPRAKAKIRVKTEAYVLLTDGSNGITLTEPRIIDVEVARGETKIIDASFTIHNQPGLESGLDRFTVKVLHLGEGANKGNGNQEPGLIMMKEGVFCPPKN